MKQKDTENIKTGVILFSGFIGILIILSLTGIVPIFHNLHKNGNEQSYTTSPYAFCSLNHLTTTLHILLNNASDRNGNYISETFYIYNTQNNYINSITTHKGNVNEWWGSSAEGTINLKCGRQYILKGNNIKTIRLVYSEFADNGKDIKILPNNNIEISLLRNNVYIELTGTLQ